MSGALTPAVLMLKAARARALAHALFDLGDVDRACNRAYDAMSDALASGVSVQRDIKSTQSGLVSAFRKHLEKIGWSQQNWDGS